jgi:ATP-binding cassette subfamily B protein
MMAGAAAATALCAYLLGTVINQAYVHRDFRTLLLIGLGAFAIFALKGLLTYGHQVIMMQIGNRIIADKERRMFDKLLRQNIAYFADHHSAEFVARLRTGAGAANHTLYLLITTFGRDLLTLIGLYVVMVIQDPIMALFGVLVIPPALIVLRKLMRRVRAIRRCISPAEEPPRRCRRRCRACAVVAFTLEDGCAAGRPSARMAAGSTNGRASNARLH